MARVNLCDTCRPMGECFPYIGEFAEEGQDPHEVCELYRKRVDTNYERLFGNPQRVAHFIIENCESDCYACPFSVHAPCYDSWSVTKGSYINLMEWLNSEVVE